MTKQRELPGYSGLFFVVEVVTVSVGGGNCLPAKSTAPPRFFDCLVRAERPLSPPAKF